MLEQWKTSISKKEGNSYTFKYVKKEDLPFDYKKSANIKLKMSDEEKKKRQKKWLNKEFISPKCSKTLKNSSRFLHNKKCNSQKQYFWLND